MVSITGLLEKMLSDLRVSFRAALSEVQCELQHLPVLFISVTLQVLHKHVPCRTQEQSLFLTAVENTWIHGRQKRRERLRQLRELPRAPPCPGTSTQTSTISAVPTVAHTGNTQDVNIQNKTISAQKMLESKSSASRDTRECVTQNPSGEQKEVIENVSEEDADMELSVSAGAAQEGEPKKESTSAASEPAKPAQSPSSVEQFLFKCLLNVMCEEGDVVVEMHWVEGQNKDLMNQLCTYLKNTLLKSVAKS